MDSHYKTSVKLNFTWYPTTLCIMRGLLALQCFFCFLPDLNLFFTDLSQLSHFYVDKWWLQLLIRYVGSQVCPSLDRFFPPTHCSVFSLSFLMTSILLRRTTTYHFSAPLPHRISTLASLSLGSFSLCPLSCRRHFLSFVWHIVLWWFIPLHLNPSPSLCHSVPFTSTSS